MYSLFTNLYEKIVIFHEKKNTVAPKFKFPLEPIVVYWNSHALLNSHTWPSQHYLPLNRQAIASQGSHRFGRFSEAFCLFPSIQLCYL